MRFEIIDGDAPEFLARMESLAEGIVQLLRPTELILVRINNWFGPRWLPFSAGTRDPDSGIAPNNLSLPIFAPNRVEAQATLKGPECVLFEEGYWIHVTTRLSRARHRLKSDLKPGIAIVWFSGRSAYNGRGSVMTYLPVGGRYHAWCAGWQSTDWKLAMTKGTAVQDLVRFIETGAVLRFASQRKQLPALPVRNKTK